LKQPEQTIPSPQPVSRNVSIAAAGRRWHIGLASTDHSRIAVAVSSTAVDTDMNRILRAFVVTLPLCLLLISA